MAFKRSFKASKKQLFALILLVLMLVLTLYANRLNPFNYGSAHSSQATPTEIFSLWNDTSPTLDGQILFNSSSLATEWSAAAVYSMYDFDENLDSKVLMQNDNTNLYIGLDLANFQTETPASVWGAAIYIDKDQNGVFTTNDRAVILKADPGAIVYYSSYNDLTETWIEIESNTPGIPLAGSQILMNTAFDGSYFESISHRQYELRIPLAILGISAGNITGIGFEAFESYSSFEEEITWPYVSSTPAEIRTSARFLGDIYLGKDTGLSNYYADYVIEENTNLKSDVIGVNKGVFMGTIDVDSNGDLEIVVSSNETDANKDYLLAIYDFVDGEMTRIWSSWTTSHQSKLFQIKGIAAYDFNGDSEEELYVCGEDSRLLRFSGWNDITKDFSESKYVFIHSPGLMGYISIGDPDNDSEMEIVCSDQQGKLIILYYDSDKDEFDNDYDSPFDPIDVLGEKVIKIHAVEVADMDSDTLNELIILSQPYNELDEPKTYLQIYRYTAANKYLDNNNDDLPGISSITTEDYYGHTILVGDAANNGEIMTIIVGRDYLRMFEQYTFANPSPPLELLVNDGSYNPSLAGGAVIADIDNDTRNELIFGANNGTLFIGEVVDQGSSYEFILEWSSDIGSSPGNREAITVFDFDEDGDNEVIVGDNFGQIQVIGKSKPPEISITSPTSGSTFSSSKVLVTWDASDDFAIHHYDIKVESVLFNRIPGSQNSHLVSIASLDNHIEIIAFDVSGKNGSDSIDIGFTAFAPEVHILSPENNYYVSNASIIVYYENIDPNGDFDYYEVWVNSILLLNNTAIEWVLVPTFSDGLYNITIVGVDDLKNRGKNTIFITKDSSAPFISITSPLTGTYIKNPEIDIYWTASDAISGISHFDIIKDDSYLTSTTNFHELISLEVDKTYQFDIEAFDLLGNSRNASFTITKDSVEPNVTILYHQTGDILTDTTLNLNWDSNDNYFGSGIHHTEVSINQITKYSGTDESTSILLDKEGRTDVLLTTFDKAGNSKTAYVSLILDVSDPYVSITNPMDGYTTGFDYVLLNWESIDNGTGIKEFQLYVNGISYQNITDSSIHNALVNIPTDTTSTITVRALDYIDRFYTDSISVTQSSSLSEVIITSPSENLSYSSISQIDLSWDIANMPNISYFEIYIDELLEYTLDNLTRNQLVDLGVIPIGVFPLKNITILAISINPNENYTDTIWILVDQSIPFISIIIPENNSIITSQILYVQWTGNDLGSGLLSYQILLDNETQLICTFLQNYHYINFDLGNKNYTLTIIAQDKANNLANSSILIIVVMLSPEFQTNISTTYYTMTGVFNFNFSITDPRTGVKSYYILMDDNPIINYNFYPAVLLNPYSKQINVLAFHYTILKGPHILSIGIIDSFSRERTKNYPIIVDTESPTILPSIIVDSQSYSLTEIIKLTQNSEPSKNNHSIRVTVSDNYVIDKVIFSISGVNYTYTREMVLYQATKQQTNSFYIIFDIGTLNSGDYNITITAYDYAGNSSEISIKITILPPETIPWLLRGNNIIYFSVVLFDFLLLVIVFSIAIRRPILNRNWQEEVLAVMYIRSTGLVCTSVQYEPQQIQEEQLVGGATVAIQEILNEYSSKKDRKSLRTLEIGNRSLLLTTGIFGYGAVIVQSLKPKHKDLLKAFTKRFERRYQDALKNVYYVDSSAFINAKRLVENFFGRADTSIEQITKFGIKEQLQEIQEIKPEEPTLVDKERKELLEDITPIDELLNQISKEAKNRLLKVIENTPKVIIALAEHQLEQADQLADIVANDLEFLLKLERSNKDFSYFIDSMLYIATEIDNAIEKGKHGYNHEMQLAIERASKIWFDEIADKWSDIH
ncbi:MAG: hypothetical protein KGD59_00715 [Candidatus Heimdallarchaeota archaeon]|nr:hypothetical protein [Candidatus Heimdallarchaeota archaeon]